MGGSTGGGIGESDIKTLEEKAKQRLADAKKGTEASHVFISFASEDEDDVIMLRGQVKSDKNDLEFDDFSLKNAINSKNEDYIKQEIRSRIDKASITLVYLTPDSATSKWVDWEIAESLKRGKGVIGIYKGDTPPTKLPQTFTANGCKAVKWNHDAIMQAIKDAKNKKP